MARRRILVVSAAPKSEPIAYVAILYAPAAHEGFLCSSWCKGARRPWRELAMRLRRPTTRCVVAHVPGDADLLLGWAAVDHAKGAVIWCYVRDLYGKVRRRGLGASLLLEAGINVLEPEPCLYWSPTAAAIAAEGKWRLYYDPKPKERVYEMQG